MGNTGPRSTRAVCLYLKHLEHWNTSSICQKKKKKAAGQKGSSQSGPIYENEAFIFSSDAVLIGGQSQRIMIGLFQLWVAFDLLA